MIYLDNAATSFQKPEQVYLAVEECLKNYCVNPGRAGHHLSLKASRVVYDTRETLAELFGISDPLRIVFTSNATDSLNLAIKGSLKPGDHVVTTSMEHNSVVRPLKALEEQGVEVSITSCDEMGQINMAHVKAQIKENTKMFISTHASNLIGTLMPIAEMGKLCKEQGIIFLVDASQSAGVYSIDVKQMNIDLLALPGHKSIMGIPGSGMLYVGSNAVLRPIKEGGTGSKSEELTQPLMLPDRYESGTLNLPGIVSMGAGVSFINQETIEKIREHETTLTKLFLDGICNMKGIQVYGVEDAQKRAPVVALNFQNIDSSEAAYLLDKEYEICIRAGIHCAPLAHKTIGTLESGAVRFSMGYFNTKDEILKAIDGVYAVSKR